MPVLIAKQLGRPSYEIRVVYENIHNSCLELVHFFLKQQTLLLPLQQAYLQVGAEAMRLRRALRALQEGRTIANSGRSITAVLAR